MRRVYHLAAIYDLAVPIELAQRVNVDGTGNVLELCAAAEKLERLAYVSTAYVAGLRTGVVYEHELVMGQEFKNHYESTKFQAEVWVREAMDRVPDHDPAAGDRGRRLAAPGETQKFDGPYYLLARDLAGTANRPAADAVRPLATPPSTWCRWTTWWRRSPRRPRCPRPRARPCTWWTPSRSPRASCCALLAEHYGAPRAEGPDPARAWSMAALRVPPVAARFGSTPRESIAYLNHPVVFDTRRTVDLLGARGLTPPHFREYVGADGALLQRARGRPGVRAQRRTDA